MKKVIKVIALSLATSALLTGCGSDSSSSNDNKEPQERAGMENANTSPSPTNTPNVSQTEETAQSSELLTGYFIDAEVAGASYVTSSGESGVTDRFGRFSYKEGDSVKLSLGNLLLGEVAPTAEGLITPETLSDGDEVLKDLLLRVLQSVDSDNNPANGITLSSDVATSLENIEEIDIKDLTSEQEILDIDNEFALAIDEDFDGKIDVSSEEAQNHFEQSSSDWNNGKRPETEHGSTEASNMGDSNTSTRIDVNSSPKSTLTPELKNAIAYMGNEERLAYDVYHNLYNHHMSESAIEIKQLKNISEKSEIKHVGIVQDIVRKYALNPEDTTNVIDPVASKDVAFEDMPSGKYDVPAIQSLYDMLYTKGVDSQQDALEVGCMVEVTDVDDLDKYIVMAEASDASDIIDAFNVLRDGSYNHYWAFDKGLKNLDIVDGCCSLGTTYCKPEYPQNENDTGHDDTQTDSIGTQQTDSSTTQIQGEGQGQGQGQGGKGRQQ